MRFATHLALGLVVGSASLIAAAPGRQTPTAGAVVAGQVVDASSGQGVGGAVVTLGTGAPPAVSSEGFQAPVPAASRRAVAIANADGRFVFRDVPAGDFSLVATLEGYAAGASGRRRPGGTGRSFPVAPTNRPVTMTVPVWKLAAISGVVRDDRGEPAVGVVVTAMRRTTTAGRTTLVYARGETTDDRGMFRIHGLMPETYAVVVRAHLQTTPVDVVDSFRGAVATEDPRARMREWGATGRIQPAPGGLSIDGWHVGTSIGMPPPLRVAGRFVVVHPTVFYPGVRSASEATLIALAAGDDRPAVDLRLPLVTGVRVSGVLSTPEGLAVNHGLRLMPVSRDSDSLTTDYPEGYATTDGAGRFAFFGIAPGDYVLRGYRVTTAVATSIFASLPVTVGSDHVDGLAMRLAPGARISGRVAFDGTSPTPAAALVQRITLGLRAVTGTLPVADAQPDENGRFNLSGYPPGRYTLSAIVPSSPGTGSSWTLASVLVGGREVAGESLLLGTEDISDAIVTFTDRTIVLAGTVRAAGATRDAAATVVVFPADTDAWIASGMSARRVAAGEASADGAYSVRVLLPGDYFVVALPPEIAPEVDREFIRRYAGAATRVRLRLGDALDQPLALARQMRDQ